MTTIVAIDPGKTTGVAWTRGLVMSPVVAEMNQDDLYDWLVNGNDLRHLHSTVYVVESFTLRPGAKSHQTQPLEIIGFIDGAVRSGLFKGSLVKQSPAQGKSFGTDEKLKKLGFWVPGKGHAMDAMRHLVTYAVTHKTQYRDPWLRRLTT